MTLPLRLRTGTCPSSTASQTPVPTRATARATQAVSGMSSHEVPEFESFSCVLSAASATFAAHQSLSSWLQYLMELLIVLN